MRNLLRKRFRIPCWLLTVFMVLYTECLLYFWTAFSFAAGRFAAVVLFALAFGGALGFVTALLPARAGKWAAVVLSTLAGVMCLLQFFMVDAYQVFIPMISVFASADNVAAGYTDTVVTLLKNSVGRISLVFLPVILYAVFAENRKQNWKMRSALAGTAVVLYLAGFAVVKGVGMDSMYLGKGYNFDGAVRSFGVNMALVLDVVKGAGTTNQSDSFDIPQTQPPETVDATEPAAAYESHVFDLDYAALAEEEQDENIASIHSYVASQTPSTENEYTGLFEGKNLILITAESFSSFVVDPELSPTLYRMATEGIQFTDYYHPRLGSNTTGGEFANLVGIIPYGGTTTMMEAVEQDLFLTMGNQLQALGYSSAAYHNNDHMYYDRHLTHEHLGYDIFQGHGNGLEDHLTNVWTRSDLEMIDYTIPLHLDSQPFSLYYMTVSGHSIYNETNAMAAKNYPLVEHLDCAEPIKYYLASNLELEFAMESLLRQLEEAGIADDTVVVLSTDHYPYGLANSNTWGNGIDYVAELYGVSPLDDFTRDSSTLIIWSGCLEDKDIVVDDPVTAFDMLPTLSNLFGVEYDSRLLIGRDVFSDTDPLVFWPLSFSWKTDKGTYNAETGVFTPAEGVTVEEGYTDRIDAIVQNKILYSKMVQKYDYFNVLSDLLGNEKD